MDNLPLEVVSHMSIFVTIKTLGSLFSCGKKFITACENNLFWKKKLAFDFQMNGFTEMTHKESYKWKILTGWRTRILWQELDQSGYDLKDSEVREVVNSAVITSGPQIDINIIWKELDESVYYMPAELKPIIEKAARMSNSSIYAGKAQ